MIREKDGLLIYIREMALGLIIICICLFYPVKTRAVQILKVTPDAASGTTKVSNAEVKTEENKKPAVEESIDNEVENAAEATSEVIDNRIRELIDEIELELTQHPEMEDLPLPPVPPSK